MKNTLICQYKLSFLVTNPITSFYQVIKRISSILTENFRTYLFSSQSSLQDFTACRERIKKYICQLIFVGTVVATLPEEENFIFIYKLLARNTFLAVCSTEPSVTDTTITFPGESSLTGAIVQTWTASTRILLREIKIEKK